MKIGSCLKSMRLRTLPLSLSGVVAGMALAAQRADIGAGVIVSLLLTASLLQILSNLSNELGDTLHGTDTAERQGIHYSLQDGEMTIEQMKHLIAVVACLCCISGLSMIWLSFKTLLDLRVLGLIVLGAASIWAAMHYTLGDNPYGYRGLGGTFVFIFFGLAAVLGSGFVCAHIVELPWGLPAAAFGCWSIGVLNVNNIRDMKTDAATRTTVALKLGLKKARIYHVILICTGWLMMSAFSLLTSAPGVLPYIYFVTVPLFALHVKGVLSRVDRDLDPMLPMLVLSTFATSLLFAAGLLF